MNSDKFAPAKTAVSLKLVQFCCVPCIQGVLGAAEGSGSATCDDGLVLRAAPPTSSFFGFGSTLLCLPPLLCGSDPGATCCTDGDACFGTDGFGTPLTCVEGTCERCGLRGTPPCDGVNSSDVNCLCCNCFRGVLVMFLQSGTS